MKLSNSHFISLFELLVYWFIVYFCFYGIQFTDDIIAYKYFYNGENASFSDLMLIIIRSLSHYYNFGFNEFYFLIIIFIFITYYILFKKLKINAIICLISILLIQYVQIANQIRYFLAFPLFLLANYYFIVEKSKIKFSLCLILSVLSHSGILALFIIFPIELYIIKKNKLSSFIHYYFIIGIISLFCFSLFSSIFLRFLPKYLTYLSDHGSSFLGSIFALVLPSSILYLMKKTYYLKYTSNNNIFNYLRLTTFFPIIFMIVSLSSFQIINARYVNSFCGFWIIAYLFYCNSGKINKYTYPLFISIIFFIKYLIFGLLSSQSGINDIDRIIQITESISR